MRNTRVIDIVTELEDYNCAVDVYDPWVASEEVESEHGIMPIAEPSAGSYDAIILAVAHRQFRDMGYEAIRTLGKRSVIIYDLKYVLSVHESDIRL